MPFPELNESLKKAREIREVDTLAEAHWLFLQKWLRMVYLDAFIHGYKHGKSSKEAQID